MKHYAASALVALSLIGCTTTTPAVHEYTLLPVHHQTHNTVPVYAKTLSLMPIKALPSLSQKHLVYVQANGETGTYLYARWNDTPAAMIEKKLSLVLEENNIFASLVPASSSAKADWLLESNLHAFQHRFLSSSSSEGIIDISIRIIDSEDKHVIASKRFTLATAAQTSDSKGGIEAISTSSDLLCREISQWLSTLSKEKK